MSLETNTYEGGQPDKRLSATDEKPSRFRPRYRKLTATELLVHDEIKAQAVGMEALFASVPEGRYKSMALTALEESVMWAVKGLTQ